MPFNIGQRVRTTVDDLSHNIPAGTPGTILNYDTEWDDYHVLLDIPETTVHTPPGPRKCPRKGTYGGDELAAAD